LLAITARTAQGERGPRRRGVGLPRAGGMGLGCSASLGTGSGVVPLIRRPTRDLRQQSASGPGMLAALGERTAFLPMPHRLASAAPSISKAFSSRERAAPPAPVRSRRAAPPAARRTPATAPAWRVMSAVARATAWASPRGVDGQPDGRGRALWPARSVRLAARSVRSGGQAAAPPAPRDAATAGRRRAPRARRAARERPVRAWYTQSSRGL
jgi:hypothetical protein